jgi:8-oxo-dGTP pyrophosphatase MutT (NUDIX family)
MSAQLREAASVILLRRAEPGFEVFLLRRHKKASFMASAFVFPGGGSEPGEDARTTAARELFEEAGILLARVIPDEAKLEAKTLEIPIQAAIRRRILGGADAHQVMAEARIGWSTDTLVPWAHWITPSLEPKRFSARFFVCEIPAGQVPSFDDVETVDQAWVRPRDAIARSGELQLPPPQIRTFWELSQLDTIEAVLAAGRARGDEPHPIMPRLRAPSSPDAPPANARPCLLLPWDPEYTDAGTGDATPLTYTPSWAVGPSRFVMEDKRWLHIAAPGSTTAG